MIINIPENNLSQSVAKINSSNSAVLSQSKNLTYSDLDLMASRLQNHLISKGIKCDEKVMIFSENSIEYILHILALWKISAIPVLVNSKLEKEELQKTVEIAKAKFILTDKVTFDFPDNLKVLNGNETYYNTNLETQSDATNLNSKIILFTSGSLGNPKGVLHTLGNIYNSVNNIDQIEHYKQNDTFLLSLPLYHIGGLMIFFRSWFAGARVCIPQKLKTEELIDEIKNQNITILSLVPTQLQKIVELRASCPPELRSVYLGGAASDESVIIEAIKLGWKIKKVYGSSETCSMAAYFDVSNHKEKINSSGQPLPNNQFFVFNKNKQLCRINETGEIGIRSNCLFKFYFPDGEYEVDKNESDTFLTGDLGFIDEQGFLFLQSRKKRIIISGGENIDPSEVELTINKLNGISDVFVFGRKDEEWGEILCAAIESDYEFTLGELKKELGGKIARFKMPKEIRIIKSFPRTELGKIKYEYLINLFQNNI